MKIQDLFESDEKHALEFGATALGYNHPMFFSFGKTIKNKSTLKKFNAELITRAGCEHCEVTELYIGRHETEDYDDVGTVDWGAKVTVNGACDATRAKNIGEDVGGMLFGQYALGDGGELDYIALDDKDI